jgi:hypothetical protein
MTSYFLNTHREKYWKEKHETWGNYSSSLLFRFWVENAQKIRRMRNSFFYGFSLIRDNNYINKCYMGNLNCNFVCRHSIIAGILIAIEQKKAPSHSSVVNIIS